jgi:pimeloyl-ACP methyl ester carboxylesterase
MLAAAQEHIRTFSVHGAEVSFATLGPPADQAPLQVVWAHGWGQDHRFFVDVARGLDGLGAHTLLDLPGFGRSPPPPGIWGTEDYADAIADWLKTLPRRPRVWVGHSFGCRVGLQLAARHPDAVDGLFLVAAAGLPRTRSAPERLHLALRVAVFKLLKSLSRLGLDAPALRQRLGSADYRNAGPMRPIFVKVVREDLSEVARAVRCPVTLVYGALDTETPPEIGERLAALIPGAQLVLLPRLDHYSILTAGSHQLQYQLRQFAGRLAP